VNERACKRCGRQTWSPHSPYCRDHRAAPELRARWAAKTREARGYGAAHRTLRAQVARVVDVGQAACARCGGPILPGEPFDLDHGPDRSSYLGPSHQRCNRKQGARDGAAVTNARRRLEGAGAKPGYARHWSRVWSWPIPPDTYVAPKVVRAYREQEGSECLPPPSFSVDARAHPCRRWRTLFYPPASG
jgi:hypothetical protein